MKYEASEATHDPYALPEGLPVPADDGAADHLPGAQIPDVVLPSSQGDVALAQLADERLVLYVYPQTGPPDRPVPGVSSQPLSEQMEFAERTKMPFPVISDDQFVLAAALSLPTFEFDGGRFYKRLSLIVEKGVIVKVFYPVFPPDGNAVEVLEWLRHMVREGAQP